MDRKLVKRLKEMENLIDTDFTGKGEVLVTSPFCRMFMLTVTTIFSHGGSIKPSRNKKYIAFIARLS